MHAAVAAVTVRRARVTSRGAEACVGI
jgi:hypothetical protein